MRRDASNRSKSAPDDENCRQRTSVREPAQEHERRALGPDPDGADPQARYRQQLEEGLFLYFLPTVIAIARDVRNQASIAVINFFLGWTFVGWVVALAMAFRTRD